jgi:hypothetical protein
MKAGIIDLNLFSALELLCLLIGFLALYAEQELLLVL